MPRSRITKTGIENVEEQFDPNRYVRAAARAGASRCSRAAARSRTWCRNRAIRSQSTTRSCR